MKLHKKENPLCVYGTNEVWVMSTFPVITKAFPIALPSKILQTIFCSFPPHEFVRWKLLGLERDIEAPCVCTNRWLEIMVITLMTWLLCFPVVQFRSTARYQNMRYITKYCNNWKCWCWGLMLLNTWHHIMAYIYSIFRLTYWQKRRLLYAAFALKTCWICMISHSLMNCRGQNNVLNARARCRNFLFYNIFSNVPA